ncbi:MAG: type II toxin-antitoxin system RatA family toxin [Gammaproteobacteria bacterium]|nr:type II toxin-antitoxin system RatA family toxin [Gammaproteobacteria bacterium]
MPIVQKSAIVPYSASEMFVLVDDVDAYPQFLPWCSGARVHSRTEDEVHATVEIAHGALHKSFSTRNRLQAGKMIEMRLVDGPFRRLEGFWRFDALGDKACKVSLDLEFEFSSRIIGMALGPVFSQITSTFVDSFRRRAEQVYGKSRGLS